jgi:A/G-specific adenine glycosylase
MTIASGSAENDQSADLASIRQALLTWFADFARDLPWRHTRDPYPILVSEVMLQQTQVDRVVPKYHAFLEQFPTIEALAAAPTAAVIRAWSGLGYNRRAVNMQRAARAVLDQHGGQFPRDIAALRRFPGIGPYTAGAIACFAFEQDVAFMDTNIRRVVRRLFVGAANGAAPSEARLADLAQSAIPPGQGWAWNQAIMELGALVCTATTPNCWRCPLQADCRDYADRRASDERLFAEATAVGEPLSLPRASSRALGRAVAERRETPYAGSSRFYRGRIVEALRQLPPGQVLPLDELGPHVKAGFGAADRDWLDELVEGLVRDGLLMREGDAARLPE